MTNFHQIRHFHQIHHLHQLHHFIVIVHSLSKQRCLNLKGVERFGEDMNPIRGAQRQFSPKYKCTLQTHFRLFTFWISKIHSKQRYKICICSVLLGELESLRNYKGFGTIFQKI